MVLPKHFHEDNLWSAVQGVGLDALILEPEEMLTFYENPHEF
jgi:hypothetical protein